MRLLNSKKQSYTDVFSDKSKICLFESRVDESKKSGDLELYKVSNSDEPLEVIFEKKIKFLTLLLSNLGE